MVVLEKVQEVGKELDAMVAVEKIQKVSQCLGSTRSATGAASVLQR